MERRAGGASALSRAGIWVDPPGRWCKAVPVTLVIDHDDYAAWVARLADPLRAKHAFWHLVLSGPAALPAIRQGLRDDRADTRMYCAKALDHLVDEEAMPDVVALLDDPDARVRWDALHALACDRCKDNACRPQKADVLGPAIAILQNDPSPHVRAIACEVIGRWVHTDAAASEALVAAQHGDPAPAVRKKAGWYAPGGPIYNRSRPG